MSLGVTYKRSPCRPLAMIVEAHRTFRSRLFPNGRRAYKTMKCSIQLQPSLIININSSRTIECRGIRPVPKEVSPNTHASGMERGVVAVPVPRTLAFLNIGPQVQVSNRSWVAPVAQAFRNPQQMVYTWGAVLRRSLTHNPPTHCTIQL